MNQGLAVDILKGRGLDKRGQPGKARRRAKARWGPERGRKLDGRGQDGPG